MFAVCQRSLFNASPAESECKGRNFLNNDQMFGRLFLKKVRSGRYRTGNTHFRNGETGENGREGALLLAALQPHIIYYMPCGMSYTSSPVAGIGFLAKKQAAWREPGGLHEFPEIPIEDLSKAHRRMGEAWGGGIESACLDCLNRSQPDAHAGAGGMGTRQAGMSSWRNACLSLELFFILVAGTECSLTLPWKRERRSSRMAIIALQ